MYGIYKTELAERRLEDVWQLPSISSNKDIFLAVCFLVFGSAPLQRCRQSVARSLELHYSSVRNSVWDGLRISASSEDYWTGIPWSAFRMSNAALRAAVRSLPSKHHMLYTEKHMEIRRELRKASLNCLVKKGLEEITEKVSILIEMRLKTQVTHSVTRLRVFKNSRLGLLESFMKRTLERKLGKGLCS